jgi:crotonobetainyl-CoA:carnitine CoA-transferase CaiB-like acyl-CoA transferase
VTPLGHLRLLDLSRQLPGPFCSTLLADLGMDVLVVANPRDPFGAGIPFLGRNKRSMTLDLKAERGREIFLRLAADADVVLEGFRPGVTDRLGIGWETLRARNPRLVYCAISGYGQDGPYRTRVGHDINYLAQAGVLGTVGEAGRPPALNAVPVADVGGGGLTAAVGILTALLARERTGRGQMVDVAMLDGSFAMNVYNALLSMIQGRAPGRGGAQLTGFYPCYAVYQTRDGRHVTVGAYEAHFWARLCRHFGREDFVARQWDEGAGRDEMFAFFRQAFRDKTMAEWVRELGDVDICFAPVLTVEEAFDDPQLRHRGMVATMDTAAGPMRFPGPPIHLSETPASLRTPPPVFGADTDAVLAGLGLGADEITALHADGVV